MVFSITQNNNTSELLNTLLGNAAGLSNFSITATGNPAAFGIFQDDPFGLESGIVLSPGSVAEIPGDNDSISFSTDFNQDFEEDSISLNITFDAGSTVDNLFFTTFFFLLLLGALGSGAVHY